MNAREFTRKLLESLNIRKENPEAKEEHHGEWIRNSQPRYCWVILENPA